MLTNLVLDGLMKVERWFHAARTRRRWERLRALGMNIGRDVMLPPSTWIDVAHCYLISIGDRTRLGPQCLILAHDAQMDEFLDAGRLGRVTIGADCRIGARCVILCNVEIGPGTIVEAGAVVATSLPANSYCAGSPARPVCSIEEHGRRIARDVRIDAPRYTSAVLQARLRHPDARKALFEELTTGSILVDRGSSLAVLDEDRGLSA